MKKKLSLKWKLAGYLAAVAAILIGIIILFQIVLLKPMYERNKISALKTTADQLEQVLDTDDIDESVYRIALKNDVCVRVFGKNDDISIGNMGCVLYRMSDYDFVREVNNAKSNHNAAMTSREESSGSLLGENIKSYTYTRLVETEIGMNVIMVNTVITPVDATIRTLTAQLRYIVLIILIVILLVVILMQNGIVKPLMRINEDAKRLSNGEYEANPKNDKYREAVELNRTLKQAAIDIKRADQAKRDLISNVSHDLRTPLTMINGYGEMMRDLPGEKTDENIQVIIDESKRLTTLVNDLLDLSRMEANNIQLEYSRFDIQELIRNELRKYDVYRYQDGYEIVFDSDEQVMVEADSKRIAQVFNNFMTNAINYSGEHRKIIVRTKTEQEHVRVEVQDFGEGIEEKEIPYVWDRYYKIDKKHIRSVNGSGIGLAIVKQILDLHKVKYGVISRKNEGSTFWFELPITKN